MTYGSAVMRSAAVPFGWIIGCPLLGFISDRIGRRKPVIIGGAFVLLVCLAWILYGKIDVFPPYMIGLVAGLASGAAMLPYTVIKEANPPQFGGTATGVVNFLNFTFSALLGTGVRLDSAARFRWRCADGTRALPNGFCAATVRSGDRDRVGSVVERNRTFGANDASDKRGLAMKQGTATRTGTGKYEQLLERCLSLAPVPTAVAYPCEATALSGAVEAAEKKLITPILVGPADEIAATAKSAGIDLGTLEIVDVPNSIAAAAKGSSSLFGKAGRRC